MYLKHDNFEHAHTHTHIHEIMLCLTSLSGFIGMEI